MTETIEVGSRQSRKSRVVKNETQRQVNSQLSKVLGLSALLLLLLLYILLSNLPHVLPARGLRPVFSIYRLLQPLNAGLGPDGKVYVSESQLKRVLVFTSGGDFLKRLNPTKGKGSLGSAFGVAVDANNKGIYVADFIGRAVNVYGQSGKLIRRFPKNPYISAFGQRGFVPFDLELYQDKVYVSTRNGLAIFSKKGELKQIWGQARGHGLGDFDFVNAVAVEKQTGNVFIADTLNRRVVALTPKGQVKWVAGKPDKGSTLLSYFGLPKGLVVDDYGRVFVADAFNHRIVVLNAKDGSIISLLGKRGVEDGKFNFPEGLDLQGNRLAVADRANNRVQVFTVGSNLPDLPKGEKNTYKGSLFQPKKNQKYLGQVKVRKFQAGDKPAPGQKI